MTTQKPSPTPLEIANAADGILKEILQGIRALDQKIQSRLRSAISLEDLKFGLSVYFEDKGGLDPLTSFANDNVGKVLGLTEERLFTVTDLLARQFTDLDATLAGPLAQEVIALTEWFRIGEKDALKILIQQSGVKADAEGADLLQAFKTHSALLTQMEKVYGSTPDSLITAADMLGRLPKSTGLGKSERLAVLGHLETKLPVGGAEVMKGFLEAVENGMTSITVAGQKVALTEAGDPKNLRDVTEIRTAILKIIHELPTASRQTALDNLSPNSDVQTFLKTMVSLPDGRLAGDITGLDQGSAEFWEAIKSRRGGTDFAAYSLNLAADQADENLANQGVLTLTAPQARNDNRAKHPAGTRDPVRAGKLALFADHVEVFGAVKGSLAFGINEVRKGALPPAALVSPTPGLSSFGIDPMNILKMIWPDDQDKAAPLSTPLKPSSFLDRQSVSPPPVWLSAFDPTSGTEPVSAPRPVGPPRDMKVNFQTNIHNYGTLHAVDQMEQQLEEKFEFLMNEWIDQVEADYRAYVVR